MTILLTLYYFIKFNRLQILLTTNIIKDSKYY